jgi:hypothetical protein
MHLRALRQHQNEFVRQLGEFARSQSKARAGGGNVAQVTAGDRLAVLGANEYIPAQCVPATASAIDGHVRYLSALSGGTSFSKNPNRGLLVTDVRNVRGHRTPIKCIATSRPRAGTNPTLETWPTDRWEYGMHEAEQHRRFVKRLHMLIHSELREDERANLARTAVLSYAAALDEAAAVRPHGELRAGAYVELHLTKAHNWLVAWRSLSDPVDPSTARVCDAALRALDDQRRRLQPRAA